MQQSVAVVLNESTSYRLRSRVRKGRGGELTENLASKLEQECLWRSHLWVPAPPLLLSLVLFHLATSTLWWPQNESLVWSSSYCPLARVGETLWFSMLKGEIWLGVLIIRLPSWKNINKPISDFQFFLLHVSNPGAGKNVLATQRAALRGVQD